MRQALIQVDENFSEKKEDLDKIADTLVKILGFLVIVPSNPEDNFFQIAEVMIQLVESHDWDQDVGF